MNPASKEGEHGYQRTNVPLAILDNEHPMRSLLAATAFFASLAPALALDQPVVWRDPDSGCAYWLTPQGGIAPRFRRDGLPDCPGAHTSSSGRPLISEEALRGLTREFGRGLDALRRELEGLRDRDP